MLAPASTRTELAKWSVTEEDDERIGVQDTISLTMALTMKFFDTSNLCIVLCRFTYLLRRFKCWAEFGIQSRSAFAD